MECQHECCACCKCKCKCCTCYQHQCNKSGNNQHKQEVKYQPDKIDGHLTVVENVSDLIVPTMLILSPIVVFLWIPSWIVTGNFVPGFLVLMLVSMIPGVALVRTLKLNKKYKEVERGGTPHKFKLVSKTFRQEYPYPKITTCYFSNEETNLVHHAFRTIKISDNPDQEFEFYEHDDGGWYVTVSELSGKSTQLEK